MDSSVPHAVEDDMGVEDLHPSHALVLDDVADTELLELDDNDIGEEETTTPLLKEPVDGTEVETAEKVQTDVSLGDQDRAEIQSEDAKDVTATVTDTPPVSRSVTFCSIAGFDVLCCEKCPFCLLDLCKHVDCSVRMHKKPLESR